MRRLTAVFVMSLCSCLPEKDLEGVACEPSAGCPAPYLCVGTAADAVCRHTPVNTDSGVGDSGVGDSGVGDSGVGDSGVGDSGVGDSGVVDSGVVGVGPTASSGGQMHFADLDGDGDLDLAYADRTSNIVSLWVQGVAGFPSAATDLPVPVVDGGIRELAMLWSGARPRFLVLPVDRSSPVLVEATGLLTFAQSRWTPFTGERVVAADALDLDDDGAVDLTLGVEGSTNNRLIWQQGLPDGGAQASQTLQTYTTTVIEGLRHGPADGGTLVVDFGDIGFRSRAISTNGTNLYSANISGNLRSLSRTASRDPERLFLGQSVGGTLIHYIGRRGTVQSDELLRLSSFENQRLSIDAGEAVDTCLGDFKVDTTDRVPALVVANANQVLVYPYETYFDAGVFPGDRWAASAKSVRTGPVAGVGLASLDGGAAVDLFIVVPGNPRTLVRISGK